MIPISHRMLQSIIDVFFADLKILRDMRRVSVVDFHAKGFRCENEMKKPD